MLNTSSNPDFSPPEWRASIQREVHLDCVQRAFTEGTSQSGFYKVGACIIVMGACIIVMGACIIVMGACIIVMGACIIVMGACIIVMGVCIIDVGTYNARSCLMRGQASRRGLCVISTPLGSHPRALISRKALVGMFDPLHNIFCLPRIKGSA
jgi:hypothetical protein